MLIPLHKLVPIYTCIKSMRLSISFQNFILLSIVRSASLMSEKQYLVHFLFKYFICNNNVNILKYFAIFSNGLSVSSEFVEDCFNSFDSSAFCCLVCTCVSVYISITIQSVNLICFLFLMFPFMYCLIRPV